MKAINLKPVHADHGMSSQATGSEIDPVCGMTVDPNRCAGSAEHRGTMYYFCSKHCVAKFQANPEQFVGRRESASAPPLLSDESIIFDQTRNVVFGCPFRLRLQNGPPQSTRYSNRTKKGISPFIET